MKRNEWRDGEGKEGAGERRIERGRGGEMWENERKRKKVG